MSQLLESLYFINCIFLKKVLLNISDKDAILIVLIMSAITTFAAAVNLVTLITYCREDEEKWKCGALLLTLFTFSAGMLSCVDDVMVFF